MATSIFKRPLDLVFVVYLLIHIPTTIIVDSQSVIPRKYYPSWATDALDWHIKVNKDHLVKENPVWFVSFVWGEVLAQLPLFLPLAIGIIKQSPWVRIPAIIYGAHVATTVQPMLAEFLFSRDHPSPHFVGAAIYLPYFLVSVALVLRFWLGSWPTSADQKAKRKAKAA